MSSYIICFIQHSTLLSFGYYIIPILYDGLLPMLEYLSVIVCLLVALEKIPLYIGTLTLCYLASGSCFQVLTAAKLVLWKLVLSGGKRR